ncbi:hypothetical protein [Streptomyces sp. NPDC048639]|uniref:hypothetical protein n=1 Tax=Streptomyces sp. NPDC048639 TaxID=3365581 RepID=UPI00370FEB4E
MSTENTPPTSDGEDPTEGTSKSTPAPETRTPAPRHRRPGLVAASVAVAVLLAGGGGAYWASTASDGGGDDTSAAGEGEPPPLRLDGYGQASAEDGHGIAPGEPNPNGSRYRALGDLPDGPGSAPVYDARSGVTRGQAEKLADALGVKGAPRDVSGSWKFGLTRDASGPTLSVSKKAPGTWTFQRYGKPGGPSCAEPPMSGPKDGQDAGSAESSPPRCLPIPGDGQDGTEGHGKDPVSEDRAKSVVGPVLEKVGLNEAKLDASRTTGAVREVNANPVKDDLPTHGWQTGLQVGADGQIVGGSGHLAELTKGADYPVLTAEDTLKRMNKAGSGGTVGIPECASAVPHKAGEAETPPCTEPKGKPGGKPAAPAKPLEVSDAVFGLAVQFVDGRETLVPSWMFEVRPSGAAESSGTYTVTHPAVKDKYIEESTPSPSAPGSDEPTSEPGKPSGESPRVTSYSADGKTVTLRFWGGVCHTYTAKADTSLSDKVVVRVTGKEKKPGQVCVKMAKEYEEKVTLDKPLGDRELMDAASGKTVAKGSGKAGPETR